jgi:predicted  nucleic acid-binding Zn-ribbon protein
LFDCFFSNFRYETRLRDVVRAYKGLAKEKEALEKSLAALSGKKEGGARETPEPEVKNATDKPKAGHGESSDNESVASSSDDVQPDVRSLKVQVRTLAASLSTVSAEKSTLEAQFQQESILFNSISAKKFSHKLNF